MLQNFQLTSEQFFINSRSDGVIDCLTTTGEIMTVVQKVTGFLDYRDFLLAYAEEQRQRNPRWTFGVWAKKLGLKGTASLTRVLQGQRNPGDEMVDRLVSYFKFEEKNAEYFRDLVRLHKVRHDPKLSLALIEKMNKSVPDSAVHSLDEKTLQALQTISNWYWPAIREMTRLRGFKSDPKWIADHMQFEISSRDVGITIDNLIDLGLLKREADGTLNAAAEWVDTAPDVASEGIKRYHDESLAQAAATLRTVPVERRDISAQCVAIRGDRISEAKELIRDFQIRFAKLMETADADLVYQFQFQFFPIAHMRDEQ